VPRCSVIARMPSRQVSAKTRNAIARHAQRTYDEYSGNYARPKPPSVTKARAAGAASCFLVPEVPEEGCSVVPLDKLGSQSVSCPAFSLYPLTARGGSRSISELTRRTLVFPTRGADLADGRCPTSRQRAESSRCPQRRSRRYARNADHLALLHPEDVASPATSPPLAGPPGFRSVDVPPSPSRALPCRRRQRPVGHSGEGRSLERCSRLWHWRRCRDAPSTATSRINRHSTSWNSLINMNDPRGSMTRQKRRPRERVIKAMKANLAARRESS